MAKVVVVQIDEVKFSERFLNDNQVSISKKYLEYNYLSKLTMLAVASRISTITNKPNKTEQNDTIMEMVYRKGYYGSYHTL